MVRSRRTSRDAPDKYISRVTRSANDENPIVSVAYVATGEFEKSMVTSDNGPRRAAAGPPPLSSLGSRRPLPGTPHFGSRSSPSPRTLSTQLSTFSKNVSGKEERGGSWGWTGYGGRQAASEKCPRSVTIPSACSFFFLFLPPASPLTPRPHPRASLTRNGAQAKGDGGEGEGGEFGTNGPHVCRAGSRFFFRPTFRPFPSSFAPAWPSFHPHDVVDLAAQPATTGKRNGQVELSRTGRHPGIRDLHLSRRRPCTTCRGHLALYSLIASGNSRIACTPRRGARIKINSGLIGCQKKMEQQGRLINVGKTSLTLISLLPFLHARLAR